MLALSRVWLLQAHHAAVKQSIDAHQRRASNVMYEFNDTECYIIPKIRQ
jgi:hypothetical protein